MAERAEKSKSAVSVLMEDFNDIDIYVEDTAIESQKIYTELINKVFVNEYKIENIISLGPSTKVIAEWKKHKELNDKRKKIFIIDGDYLHLNDSLKDYLDEENINNHKGLFVLPRYCIENFLIDFDSLVELVHEEVAIDTREQIKNNLNFDKWLSDNNNHLKDLFIYNSICQKFNIGEKTSKYKYSNLVSATNSGYFCKTLTTIRIEFLKKRITVKAPQVDIEKEYNLRAERVKNRDIISIVTGKDYLLPLLKKYISNKYDCLGMSNISFKIRISKICEIGELSLLKDQVH